MKIKVTFLLLTAGLFLLVSCQHPSVFADSPAVTFSLDISPIINSNCAMSGCHDAGGHEAKSLITYDDVMRYVKENSPDESKLYKVLYASGEDKMPRNGDLTDLQKQLIFVWIGQGAKNN